MKIAKAGTIKVVKTEKMILLIKEIINFLEEKKYHYEKNEQGNLIEIHFYEEATQ